jgi:hypothetical protein
MTVARSAGPAATANKRREIDYLVEVACDLDAPRLEYPKHIELACVAIAGADFSSRASGLPSKRLSGRFFVFASGASAWRRQRSS